jgi:hypothetical protein
MILRDKAIVEHASVAGRSLCSAGARRLTLCVGGESAAGRQAIDPPGGFTEEFGLFLRRQLTKGCLDRGHHGLAVPEQMVDRVMRGEHATPSAEDAERHPYPPTDRFRGGSEKEGDSVQLEDDVGKLTHRAEAFFPAGEALGTQVEWPAQRLQDKRTVGKRSNEIVSRGQLLIIDEQIPYQSRIGDLFKPAQPRRV